MRLACAVALAVLIVPAAAAAGAPVKLHAAGSLRAALTEVAAAFTASSGLEVAAVYGPSGTLKGRIAGGEASDVFAAANMAHPKALAAKAKLPVVLFARNTLCALARNDVAATTDTLLDAMLDAKIKLGTSTPKADPSGDYAWALFAKAEALKPGARATLERKALTLTGGPDAPTPPAGQTVYSVVMAQHKADVFLTYCTNAIVAAKQVPGLKVVAIPRPLSVGADYGLVVLSDRPAAARLALFILSAPGQAILARHGFEAPLSVP
ncbi:MAG: molybdate ABC transporter substrate-binding protein [Candidatus Eiseniibacteriota bacterium]